MPVFYSVYFASVNIYFHHFLLSLIGNKCAKIYETYAFDAKLLRLFIRYILAKLMKRNVRCKKLHEFIRYIPATLLKRVADEVQSFIRRIPLDSFFFVFNCDRAEARNS